MENLGLTDNAISHVAQLLQVAILTGTDIVDNLRAAQFVVKDGAIEISPDYFENFNIKEATQNQFISLLADCEMARYASSEMENTKMQQILKAAQEIIIEVEQQKR